MASAASFLPTIQKWYAWYFPSWAAMNAGTAVTLQSGWDWWTRQAAADGIDNAWMNFSRSPQPVAANVAQVAAAYQALGFGAPTDPPVAGTNPTIAPPLNEPYSVFLTGPGVGSNITQGATAPAPGQTLATAPVPVTSVAATPQQVAASPIVNASAAPAVSSNTVLLAVAAGIALFAFSRSRN